MRGAHFGMRVGVVLALGALAAACRNRGPLSASEVAAGGAGGGLPVVAGGVRWLGRVDATDIAGTRFAWSGSGFVARVSGGSPRVHLYDDASFLYRPIVDGVPLAAFASAPGEGAYALAFDLQPGSHTIALLRQTEGVFGESVFRGVTITSGTLLDPPPAPARLLEVVGASVSCGYGDLGQSPCGFSVATESHYDAYESVAARAVGAELSVVAISGRGMYRNSDGSSSGTMPEIYQRTLPGASDPAWDFHAAPQAVVINLGKNDFATGDPGQPFADAYLAFVRMLRVRYPSALVVCTTGPNLGVAAHARQLTYVQGVVTTRNREGDAAIAVLDWPEQTPAEVGCDGHPNAAKHQAMGNALAALLKERLGW